VRGDVSLSLSVFNSINVQTAAAPVAEAADVDVISRREDGPAGKVQYVNAGRRGAQCRSFIVKHDVVIESPAADKDDEYRE